MNDRDYTTSFTVEQTPQQAFDAINDIRGWWSQDVEGSTDRLGEEFTFRSKDIHYSLIKVAELVPGERVVWLVLDNYLNFVEDQNEWKGTRISFEISRQGNGAEVRFSHLGLVPEYECFDICSNAWGFYVNVSLRDLIATGEGQPIAKESRSPIS
jgi:hypothetical protein